MLKSLSIENIAVAKQLNIDFNDGFNVLTGETGTGKSVIISAISLILGAKIRKELIRTGEMEARVTALFEDEPDVFPFDENGEAVLERIISDDGKSRAKINSKSVSQAQLTECAASLLSLHGQKETAAFYDKSECVKFLDYYAGNSELLAQYKVIFSELQSKKAEIENLTSSLKEKEMMIDILKYQIAEIEKAGITSLDEEEKLVKMRTKLKSLEQINKNAGFVSKVLTSTEKGASVPYLLETASAALRRLTDVMENADELASKLDVFRLEIMGIGEEADALIDEDISDPDKQLDIVESRLALISKLEKKYGSGLSDVMAFKEEAQNKLSSLEDSDAKLFELNRELKEIESRLSVASSALTDSRRTAGEKLSAEVVDTLKYLDMPKVIFYVDISTLKSGYSTNGNDEVDFTIITNKGEEPRSLSSTASGGELSRIMLALRCAVAQQAGASTVVFDEIDTGVSGSTSERIGIKLSELAKSSQVICVTHSAQVSAHADTHILVEKKEINGRVESSAREIFGDEITKEIARIIGGINVTETQYKAAVDLLNNKNNPKECE